MKKAFVFIIFFLFIMRVDGTSTIVMDTDNKRVLYSSNVHDKRSVASISKIMTCIVALENGDINKKIVIGDEITGSYGSGIYIKKGEELSLKDLLYGLIMGICASSNVIDYFKILFYIILATIITFLSSSIFTAPKNSFFKIPLTIIADSIISSSASSFLS